MTPRRLPDYDLPEERLRAYHHAVGALTADGEVIGHLASVFGSMMVPPGAPWLWFVIVWADGRKEPAFEDSGPAWPTVRKLDVGYLEHRGPSTTSEGRLLGFRVTNVVRGPMMRSDYARLPNDEAAAAWARLGLTDRDF